MAIASYIFVIINAIITFTKGNKRHQRLTIILAWFLCLGGLITGMIWAELAWGRFWNWDPKEFGTILLLISISGYILALHGQRISIRFLPFLTITNLVFMVLTLFVSPAMDSIHTDYTSLSQMMVGLHHAVVATCGLVTGSSFSG